MALPKQSRFLVTVSMVVFALFTLAQIIVLVKRVITHP